MNIIVVGAGKVGRQIIGELSDSCDIVLIENSEKIIEDITSEYDIQSILGNAVNVDVLKEAGAKNADIFISVTGSDELNIISSMIANKLGAKSTVARVRSPEYSKSAKFLSSSLNITKLINPDEEAAVQILEIIKYPLAKSIEHFANKKLQMVEFKIPNGSYLDGIDLKSFRKTLGYNMIVCIVERGEEVIIPKGDTILRSNDNIYVTGSKKDMDKFYDSINVKTKKIKKVMLIGASKICFFLTELLLNEKKRCQDYRNR
ncbi:NAD-binding protein [Citroniella saccharovorans]|uniref:Trk system potassium uptake protein TrkA n=1 Tax=Citroniella saccharovorans TaxID=2053367 RepID=A0AAW9N040_9FIRM|nr:NAD-binding protein [Citroniella saccharovorans]MEB3430010.1 NAD-binding protein [Citroniella saccharovorans]